MRTLSRGAFTLVELLVVIVVIAVLLGILLPSLAGARQQAGMIAEQAGARQLMVGYLAYAMDHNESLMPGHIAETIELLDDTGRPLSPAEVSRRWPWRLVSYLGSGVHGTLLLNKQASALADRSAPMWTYMVSLTPSLGLNYFNLGGDGTAGGANNAPGCLRRADHAVMPTKMIVFASARSPGESGPVHGYFKLVPPTKPFEYSALGWNPDQFREHGEPAAWGYIHPRWNERTATAFLDGHTEALGMDELRDMRRWSNEAAKKNDPDWAAR